MPERKSNERRRREAGARIWLSYYNRVLYEKGYRNHNGKKIAHTTMSGMISNPKYKGYYVGNKVKVIDLFTKKQKFLPPEEWVMFKAAANQDFYGGIHRKIPGKSPRGRGAKRPGGPAARWRPGGPAVRWRGVCGSHVQVDVSCGYFTFKMAGIEMSLDEIHEILDSLRLSSLTK